MNEEDIFLFFDQPWETKTIPKENPKSIYNTQQIEKNLPKQNLEPKTVKFADDIPKFILLPMTDEKFEKDN